jgi:hypothetical protein
MKAKVSFVILSHNDAQQVINAVKSIRRIKTRHSFDIFVVDNGSRDNTPALVKKALKGVKVIKLRRNIGTAAYDAAIKKSRSKYIYFTGCDIEAKSDMLDKLVDFLEKNEDVAQAVPKYVDYRDRKKTDMGGAWLSRSFYSGIFRNNALGSKNTEIPYAGTGLIRASIVKKFGYLFDNDYFFYGEDVDLGMRIRLLGYKIFYIPSSIVYHLGSVSRKIHKPHFLTFLMERNLLHTFFKTMSAKSILLLLPYVLAMRFAAIIRDLAKLDIPNALARIRAIFWVALHFNSIMSKRRKIQSMRRVTDDELLRVFSEKQLWGIRQ